MAQEDFNSNQNQNLPPNTEQENSTNTNQNQNILPDPNSINPSQPYSPYFIGNNDSSGALLVTQMLDSSNYHSWNTKSIDIKSSTLYVETAHQLWLELEQRLAQQNAPKIYEIKQSIVDLQQNWDSVSMYFSKLKTLLDELLNYECIPNCTCGGGLKTVVNNQDKDWVMKFLMRLNDSYKSLKAQVLLMKPFPSLNEVYSIVQREEKRREISVDIPVNDTMALMAKATTRDAGK
ncbi:uncharacterized protein LOC111383236 [Olea europaea var. sylvestris]|uniref:uncharacterized protein LOC111383236 n=1 Tax=Olea europaea var. sylvestris TaxID=158386 RepID=UPI000C1D6D2D|nr:uncharacterized protein LOC111383236 [Olea europaea var. sylvestris]